ncbi:hypothetical protein SynMEDNS5_02337 [Synechococcus sp. MEDNS5]|nr:hypothetical protein SynMEDNS5_02337 [Synechococcus sp. MEDNS5]
MLFKLKKLPLLISLNQFLYEVGYIFYSLNRDLESDIR